LCCSSSASISSSSKRQKKKKLARGNMLKPLGARGRQTATLEPPPTPLVCVYVCRFERDRLRKAHPPLHVKR
jgi:hypothetical protein